MRSSIHAVAAALLALTWLGTAAPRAAAEPADFFKAHAFYGRGSHLAVNPPRRIRPGERVLVFAAGQAPARATVSGVMPTQEAKRAFDTLGFDHLYDTPSLWARYGAYWYFRGPDAPRHLARLSLAADAARPMLAVRDLPPGAAFMGGAPTRADSRALLARVPAAERARRPLVRALRYGARLVELYVGFPTYAAGSTAEIHAITIKRYTFVDDRLAEVQERRRETGVEEHVDVEAPRLNTLNWPDDSDDTVGFLSLDGQRWHRLTVDAGFEGIGYRITALGTKGDPDFEAYHQTPH